MKKIVLFMILSLNLFSQETMEKEVNFGDRIGMKLDNLEEKEVDDILKDFYIEKKDRRGKTTIATMRALFQGEKKFQIGDRQFTVTSASNLKPEEKEIYLDLSSLENRKRYTPQFPYFFLLGVLIFPLGIYKIFKRDKRDKIISSMEKFRFSMENLSDKEWPFQISYLLREVIDARYSQNFLQGYYKNIGKIQEKDIDFIRELDFMKFSRQNFEKDFKLKKEFVEKAKAIAEKIQEKEVENV